MPLATGTILHNRYRIVKLIGQGGFGAVYRGWDLSLEQPVAVKENFGSEGSGKGQFSFPRGIATAMNGTVYVTDWGNNRVQQFSAGGEFLNAWGSRGSGAGQFNYPWGMAVAGDGTVYVADTSNHRIQIFTPNGEFIAWWGREG